jgi:hypothetical protein
MATAKSASLSEITRYYNILSPISPTDAVLQALADRVDAGLSTLGQTLKTLYTSATVQEGPAHELAKLFFLAVGRAPDAPLYTGAMQMLRNGTDAATVADTALQIPGFALSTVGLPTDAAFAAALAQRVGGANEAALTQQWTAALAAKTATRGALVVQATKLGEVAVASQPDIDTALLYLAGTGREATSVDLSLQTQASTDAKIIAALAAAGLSATGGNLALSKAGGTVQLYGELAADLVWNAATNTYTLGGSKAFKVFFSPDGGLSGAIVDFASGMVTGATEVDASLATGKGKVLLTAGTTPVQFKAPVGGSTAVGSTGADTFTGSDGKDLLYLTSGKDTLTGGLGDDTFVLPASTLVAAAGWAPGKITDLGVGKDVLDFTRLLGKSVDVAKLVAVLADATTEQTLSNGGVALVESNGVWTSGAGATLKTRAATADDVAALFGTGKLFKAPTAVSKSVVITADTAASADVWLLLNSTDVKAITTGTGGPKEVFHVATLEGAWNPTLVGIQPVSLLPT